MGSKYPISRYIGKKFGSRTVVGRVAEIRRTAQIWILQCDCGTVAEIPASYVMQGRANNCRQCSAGVARGSKSANWRGFGVVPATSYLQFKNSAIKRCLPWEVSIEDIDVLYRKQHGKCALTGQNLVFRRNNRKGSGNASLDRIDSDLGYVSGNVWLVTIDINFAKQTLSVDDFVNLCRAVVKHADQGAAAPAETRPRARKSNTRFYCCGDQAGHFDAAA